MSEEPEGLIPYDLTAQPTAYVLLTPGWEERLKELTPRCAEAGPIWRTPSNEEWAEAKAWGREFVTRRRDLERLAQREWIADVKARLGIVCTGDDPEVIHGREFGDYARAALSLQIEEEVYRGTLPYRFEDIAGRLGEGLPEGYQLVFGPVTPIFGEDEP